jgi:hypothetical protein
MQGTSNSPLGRVRKDPAKSGASNKVISVVDLVKIQTSVYEWCQASGGGIAEMIELQDQADFISWKTRIYWN